MTQPTDRPGINQLTSDQLDALYARLEQAEFDAEQQERNYRVLMNEKASYREGWKYEQKRRAVAEATLAAVRALAERWQHTGDRKNGPLRELRAVLDQHGQTTV